MYTQSKYNYFVEYKDRVIYFNGLTRAFFSVSKEEDKFIQRQLNDLISLEIYHKDFFSFLQKQGFLINEAIDEVDLIRFKNRREVFLNKLYNIVVFPTIDCNFNCWYCYQEHPHESMSEDVFNRVKLHIAKSIEETKITGLNVNWFGGEPLLEFDRIIYPLSSYCKEILEANQLPYTQFAVTNAYLINPDMVKKMKEIDLHEFQITIDGAERKHNLVRNVNGKPTFARIIDNVNLLCREMDNATIRLRINYDNQTLKDQALKDVFENIPMEYRHKVMPDFQRVWQTLKNEKMDQNDDLLTYYHWCSSLGYTAILPTARFFIDANIRCYADRFYHSVINYDGRIYKCTGCSYTKDNAFGVLNEEGRIEWDYMKVAPLYAKATFENEKCLRCKHLPICLGPCTRNVMEKDDAACALDNAEIAPDNFIIGVYEQAQQRKPTHQCM